jgi:BirA family biotin operon repressor/biotin-[acetyl-CoA-carboxylase] ligase
MTHSERDLRKALSSLPLGGLQYFPSTGSTNDVALAWLAQGAKDFSLVAADEQTSGRGRMNRRWFTPAGSALAFSLVLRPENGGPARVSLFAGLGALALCQALDSLGLAAQIKWPNDVLINRKKVAGILVEAVWMGDAVDGLVLGMGVNVTPEAVPPAAALQFPATSVQAEVGHPVERVALLGQILSRVANIREQVDSPGFLAGWQERLAFRGERVQVTQEGRPPLVGLLDGLEADGSLRLLKEDGDFWVVRQGEVRLRPL